MRNLSQDKKVMMSREPYLSIVVPVYNRADLIVSLIDSILSQSYTHFELLIVDDGSTDNLKAVIDPLAERDSRVHYIQQSNEERGYTRNHGYRMAKGTHVLFVDSDDKVNPGYLEKLMDAIAAHPDCHFFSCRYNFFNESHLYDSDISHWPEGYYGQETMLKGNPFACNVCVAKEHPSLIPFQEDRKFSAMEDWIFLTENLHKERLWLIDFTGISMREHEQRSMKADARILNQKRILATDYLVGKGILNRSEQRKIYGHSYWFCAIHCYIDGYSFEAFTFWFKAVKLLGFERGVWLMLPKIILTKRIINRLKNVF